MAINFLGDKQLKALRLIRSGSPLEMVCKSVQVSESSLAALEVDLRMVPESVIHFLEELSHENVGLRQRIALLTAAKQAR